MPDTITVIRARCPVCHKAATNFLAWPVGGALLTCLEMKRFDCIIMNPPFSSKSANLTNAPANINLEGMRVGYYILDQCMEMSDNIIALMPWFTISDSDVRLRKLKEFGLISVTPLPRKTFAYARIQTVVIQLQHGYTGNTEFKFLPNH